MDRRTRGTTVSAGAAEMLGRLALGTSASAQAIEARYEALVDYLREAPADLRPWAHRQIADLDEAFAVLSDPEAELRVVDADDEVPEPAPTATVEPAAAPADAARPRDRRLLMVVGVLLAVAVVVGVYLVGRGGSAVPGIDGTPTDDTAAASAQGTGQLDQAKVAELMKAISTNPKDVASLQSLGDLYFSAGDYKTAATWEQKVLAVDPVNVTALLALGAAQYNQGDATNAEKQWLKVVSLDANQQEAHYDLGFLYLSQPNPDMAKVRKEWDKVVAIDPNSDVAKTVSTHLASLSSGAPKPAPSAS